MDLILRRGDTHNLSFTRKDNEGNPITTAPTALYFTVKLSTSKPNAIIQKTLDDMTFNQGKFTFTILPSDTDDLLGNFVYDIEVITDNYKQTIAQGRITIIADVTTPKNEV